MEFDNLQDLYKRMLPALRTKRHELSRKGFEYIREEDIFECLSLSKWKMAQGLTVSDMVSDILSVDMDELNVYFKEKWKKKRAKMEN